MPGCNPVMKELGAPPADELREEALLLALAAPDDALVMSEIAEPAWTPTIEPSSAVATSV